jgi:hypothetical protein
MKKIILLSLLAIVLSNCEVSVPKVSAYYEMAHFTDFGSSPYNVYYDYKSIHGMTYLVGSNYNGGLVSINITKDSLECEVLRKRLNK